MRSNYKRLGDYIQVVNERNADLADLPLLGVSIQKAFMPSIANIIGTDMSTYRIVKRSQFAYGPVTSRNGDKISIALLDLHDGALVSQAYTVFEITDTTQLLPEYLMMWFRRPEFDRYARYKSHGSAREIFDWNEMCETLLPVPSPEKQRQLVNEYHVLVDRINLNNSLIQKLEETAQALYKEWFVDFEFPDPVAPKGGTRKGYKSSGGEMVESEMGMIPKGWKVEAIKDFCKEMKSGGTPSRDEIEFWDKPEVPWIKTGEIKNNIVVKAEEYISQKGLEGSSAKILPLNTVLMSMYGANAGEIGFLKLEATTNQACCGMICESPSHAAYLFYNFLLNQEYIASLAIGGAQPNLSKALIEGLNIIKPSSEFFKKNPFEKIINSKESLTRESLALEKLKDLLLSKLATIEN